MRAAARQSAVGIYFLLLKKVSAKQFSAYQPSRRMKAEEAKYEAELQEAIHRSLLDMGGAATASTSAEPATAANDNAAQTNSNNGDEEQKNEEGLSITSIICIRLLVFTVDAKPVNAKEEMLIEF